LTFISAKVRSRTFVSKCSFVWLSSALNFSSLLCDSRFKMPAIKYAASSAQAVRKSWMGIPTVSSNVADLGQSCGRLLQRLAADRIWIPVLPLRRLVFRVCHNEQVGFVMVHHGVEAQSRCSRARHCVDRRKGNQAQIVPARRHDLLSAQGHFECHMLSPSC
jgi:hypothetical protein